MKKRRGLLDDGKPETPQLTQGKLEELRLSVAHMLLADLGTIKPDADPAFVATMEEYLQEFAKPGDGNMPCLYCGYPVIQDMAQQFLGARGGFEWGYVHGHGWCKECRWPIVMHHFIKDKDGKEVITIRFIPLQVHPDKVSLPPKEDLKDG